MPSGRLNYPYNNCQSLSYSSSASASELLGGLVKGGAFKNLIIVVRADPVICGHSTEARNLAETAKALGYEGIHIISYPLDVLEGSGLPLKAEVNPYSEGIEVHRPEGVGDYKVLDGRLCHGMSGLIIDLLTHLEGATIVMCLYLVPHGRIIMDAVRAVRRMPGRARDDIVTIAEAVGSDITSQVSVSLENGRYGAVQLILDNYLEHDVCVAVSQYTVDCIIDAAQKVDDALGTAYVRELKRRVHVSYPPIYAAPLLDIKSRKNYVTDVLSKYEVEEQKYVLFLSRISEAKGVCDLINGYLGSKVYYEQRLPLLICGCGPALATSMRTADGNPLIRFLTKVSDDEKTALFHGCAAYVLPSRPTPTFIETFGISIAEKMLCGGYGPVLTTRTGGIPEATGGFCLEIECSSPASITERLDEVCNMTCEEKEALSADAQQFALEFDRSKVFNKLLTLANKARLDRMHPLEQLACNMVEPSTSASVNHGHGWRMSRLLQLPVYSLLPKN